MINIGKYTFSGIQAAPWVGAEADMFAACKSDPAVYFACGVAVKAGSEELSEDQFGDMEVRHVA